MGSNLESPSEIDRFILRFKGKTPPPPRVFETYDRPAPARLLTEVEFLVDPEIEQLRRQGEADSLTIRTLCDSLALTRETLQRVIDERNELRNMFEGPTIPYPHG